MHRFIALCTITLLVSQANAQAPDHPAIQRSVQRGVAFLKSTQQKDGSWPRAQHHPGITALAGLALLECGLPAKDPAIQKAAAAVRRDFLKISAGKHTYSAATLILFLDRLGDAGDEPLIHALVYWLLTGQTEHGTWGYSCGALPQREGVLLKEYLELLNQSASGAMRSKEGKEKRRDEQEDAKERMEKMEALAKEIPERMKALAKQPIKPMRLPVTDHSNTQFALLGLWVGRRHGMPVDGALSKAERHFLANQAAAGSWHYRPDDPRHNPDLTPANTCNALLALAVGQVASLKAQAQPDEDRAPRQLAQQAGLAALGRIIAGEIATRRGRPPVVSPVGQLYSLRGRNFYAFLWSLDKMAAAYDLKTLGGIDWYRWGAEIALVNQGASGSWEAAEYGRYGPVDTCFALLFLSKSNITKDLTAKLKYMKSPGNGILPPAPRDRGPEGKKKPPDKGQKKPREPAPAERKE